MFRLNIVSGIFTIFIKSIMARRYLRKKTSSNEKKPFKKNHSKAALNLEVERAMAPQERVISFDKKPNNNTRKKVLHESIRDALDAAGNTCLTIRFFNLNLENKISKIEKAKNKYKIPYVEFETSKKHGFKNTKKIIKIPMDQLTAVERKRIKNYFS